MTYLQIFYELFKLFRKKLDYIEVIFYKKMLVFLINDQKRIKVIYEGETQQGI